MKKTIAKATAAKLLLILAAGLPLAGCIDDSYDLDQDIDMTMGLGADGLQLKLGNTEKIMLADILETDDNLKTDATSRYYLVETGQTSVDFRVKDVQVLIDNAHLSPESEVADYNTITALLPATSGTSVTVPANFSLEATAVVATDNWDIDVENVGSDVKRVKALTLKEGTKARFHLELRQNGTNFTFKDLKNFKIKIPDYVKLDNLTGGNLSGNVLSFENLTDINATAIDLGEADIKGISFAGETGKVADGAIHLKEQTISMTGDFSFKAASAFTLQQGNTLTVRLTVYAGNYGEEKSELDIATVTGRFDPAINPTVESINVSSNLPDFLQDDDVKVKVSNPTLKFAADMTNIPLPINLTADLSAVKGTATIAAVSLPATGVADIAANAAQTLYFYQDAAAGPFDPDGVPTTAKTYRVQNLSSLIETLPDYVAVDAANGHITAKDEDATIAVGQDYHTQLDYELLVPFDFENGLRIVYRDSTDGMNDDLKDYEADGLVLSADIVNAIPLKLVVTAEPVDTEGKAIAGISVSSAEVAAANAATSYADATAIAASATTTPVTLNIALTDRSLLKKVNRVRFRIAADGVQDAGATGTLSSKQYLVINNIRLKLKGNITGDFN